MKAQWFPAAAQVLLLAVLVLLVLGGLGVTTADPDFTQVLRDTNLANLIVWSYWCPRFLFLCCILLFREQAAPPSRCHLISPNQAMVAMVASNRL